MKKEFEFNNRIYTYEEEKIDECNSILILGEELELNDWKVEKEIARWYPKSSIYKYNTSNYWEITLVDYRGESRLIKMHQEVYVDNQMSQLCKRREFQSFDWTEFEIDNIIHNINVELKEMKVNLKGLKNGIELGADQVVELVGTLKEKLISKR